MAGTYGSYIPPEVQSLAGFLLKPEYSVIYGGAAGATYPVPNIPVGSSGGITLGLLDAFGFTITPTIQPVTGANVQESGLFEITAEEVTIQITLKEWDITMIGDCLPNGSVYSLTGGAERLMTFGGGGRVTYKPLVLNLINTSMNAPTTQGLTNGITGIIVTFPRTTCTSPFTMDQLQATEDKPLALEFRAVRDFTLPRGGQTGSIYFY